MYLYSTSIGTITVVLIADRRCHCSELHLAEMSPTLYRWEVYPPSLGHHWMQHCGVATRHLERSWIMHCASVLNSSHALRAASRELAACNLPGGRAEVISAGSAIQKYRNIKYGGFQLLLQAYCRLNTKSASGRLDKQTLQPVALVPFYWYILSDVKIMMSAGRLECKERI
jgi:hypothetical protein